MNISARATRRNACMSMKANPPSLVPPVRTSTYIDYDSMSQADIAKCNRMIDEFYKTGNISCPGSNTYFKLMVVLREHRRVFSAKGDFQKAGEVDNLIKQISQFFHENRLYKAKADQVSVAENQWTATRSRLVEVEDKWQNEIDKLKQQQLRSTRRLSDFCEQQIYNYDTKIPDSLPPAYSKLSPELLDLKEKEKHMIGCRMFKEAEALHKEFERRQKEELKKRREEYYKSFEISRNILEKRTNRKLTAMQSDWDRKINHAEHMKTKELKPLRNGCEFLERKLTTAKAEYIGEDDPIVDNEKAIFSAETYKVSPPLMTRGATPRSLTNTTTRKIERPTCVVSTRKMCGTMMRDNRLLDSSRWPR